MTSGEDFKVAQKTSAFRLLKDKMAGSVMFTFTMVSVLLLILIGVGLVIKSLPILEEKSLGELLFTSKWKPMKGDFGFLPFIMGTLWVTAIAIVWTLPVSLFTAIFLTVFFHSQTCHGYITFLLSYRKTYGIKVHVLDHQFFAKFLSKCFCDLHVDTIIIIALCIFKWLKCCVCCYHQLVFAAV